MRWSVGAFSARRTLSIATPFCDDTLGYFTERLDPVPPGKPALPHPWRQGNKAFDDCRWIGLAIDGTGAGWRTQQGSCCVGRSRTLRTDSGLSTFFGDDQRGGHRPVAALRWEPYGPGDSEYAAGQRLLRRVIGSVGKRLAQYVVADGEFATAPFLHTAGDLGLRVVHGERQLAGAIAAAHSVSLRASSHGFSAWSGSCGALGSGGFRSLGNAGVGNRSRVFIASTSRTARWWKPTG